MWRERGPELWPTSAPGRELIKAKVLDWSVPQLSLCPYPQEQSTRKYLQATTSQHLKLQEVAHFRKAVLGLLEQTGMEVVPEAGEEPDVFHEVRLHHVGPLPLGPQQ